MKSPNSFLDIENHSYNEVAQIFCDDFLSGVSPRYILGRNEYASSIAQAIDVDGFIDDYTQDIEFLGRPIIRIEAVPRNALVVSAVVGRPFVAAQRLKNYGVRFLDYFSFKRYGPVDLIPVKFWDEFAIDFELHRDRYVWVDSLLQDKESKLIFNRLINFRLSSDLEYMRGFTDTQYRQYFENFLALKQEGETFVDVGGFDGYTSLEFIKRCPGYTGVHIYEPEPGNMTVVQEALAEHEKIYFHLHGLSNCSRVLKFKADGSASRLSEQGDIKIE